MKRKIIITCAILCTSLLFFACAKNDDEDSSAFEIVSKSGDAEHYIQSIEYPVFKKHPILTEAIEKAVSDRSAIFHKLADESYAAQRDTAAADDKDKVMSPYVLNIEWEQAQINKSYISILLTTYYYTGGANGITEYISFNYDVKQKKLLDLPSVLNKLSYNDIAAKAEKSLMTQINADNDAVLTKMIKDGTEPKAENFSLFTFNDSVVTLYFQKYQVAPGSFGVVSIELPIK